MGSVKKMGVANLNSSLSPIGSLIMTRSLIYFSAKSPWGRQFWQGLIFGSGKYDSSKKSNCCNCFTFPKFACNHSRLDRVKFDESPQRDQAKKWNYIRTYSQCYFPNNFMAFRSKHRNSELGEAFCCVGLKIYWVDSAHNNPNFL